MSVPSSGRTSPDLGNKVEALPAIITQPPPGGSASLLEPKPSSARSFRQNSPACLSTNLTLKFRSQLNRVACIDTIMSELPADASSLTINDIDSELEQLEALHAEFLTCHTYCELNWPAAFIDHECFHNNIHQAEANAYRKTKRALTRAKTAILARQAPPPPSAADTRGELKLPDIQLKIFSGEYADWPSFKEMFNELIMKNSRISDMERLHYLRSCMAAGPAELIANFPSIGTSLQPSWEMLNSRYENKRLLIQA